MKKAVQRGEGEMHVSYYKLEIQEVQTRSVQVLLYFTLESKSLYRINITLSFKLINVGPPLEEESLTN